MHTNHLADTTVSSLQKPIGSPFGAASTAEDVIKDIDLSGKVAIVTGGYSGIGLETVRVLHAVGAKVIVPTRDRAKAEAALNGLEKAKNRTNDREGIEIEMLDLLDPVSIDGFAGRFLASGRPLHILVNSAGIMACPFERDVRGYELQFATNHLGHFQLTASLWPALGQANGARVVALSSWGHRFSPVVFDDPNFQHRNYDRLGAYGQSKTANILFALALDQRGKEKNVRAFSLHPGSIVATGLGKHFSKEELRMAGVIDEQGNPILDPSKNLKTVGQGAATGVWCATSSLLNDIGGVYCENCEVALPATSEVKAQLGRSGQNGGVMPYAIDPGGADQLWSLSERLTGVTLQ